MFKLSVFSFHIYVLLSCSEHALSVIPINATVHTDMSFIMMFTVIIVFLFCFRNIVLMI